MFTSRNFIVPSLTFRSLIHCEFIFVQGIRDCSKFHSLKCSFPVFPAPLIEEPLFSLVYSYLLCYRLIGHKCGGFISGISIVFIDLCFCFCAGTILSQ